MVKGLVLSSGGVDSTTCVALAIKDLGIENVATVSFSYGQRHTKELVCARAVAGYYDIPHYVINLADTGIYEYSNCALLGGSTKEIKHEDYATQIKEDGIVNTYVPFRNGLMLSCAAALASSINADDQTYLYLGAHADDAAGNAYADCSVDFVKHMEQAIHVGTYGLVQVVAPLVDLTKKEVVKSGLELNAPYHLTWSCYEGGTEPCGKCATCVDRIKAFELNGVVDPIMKVEE